ncbi:hypothetical protein CVT25_005498 [Psilocybe cyanescens]|uniref:Uncharacterized protein n=1 Tax=Psilocybe cyanescens TaxID=93625 RepID=A0A409VZY2_PSICY|nr:hypothetical protein CVT25_005498 [Psilocybe cyanescens]
MVYDFSTKRKADTMNPLINRSMRGRGSKDNTCNDEFHGLPLPLPLTRQNAVSSDSPSDANLTLTMSLASCNIDFETELYRRGEEEDEGYRYGRM